MVNPVGCEILVSVILGKNMKPVHIPRTLIILILVLVAVTFLAGVLHAFETAHAAPATMIASHQAGNNGTITPTPVPTAVSVSGDTTGIIALAILIVIIVLVGAILGGNRSRVMKKTH